MPPWSRFPFSRHRAFAALTSAALLSLLLTAATLQTPASTQGGWTLTASVPATGSTVVAGPNDTWDVLEHSGTIVELSATGTVQATWKAQATALVNAPASITTYNAQGVGSVSANNLVYITTTRNVDLFNPATNTVLASWPTVSDTQIPYQAEVLGMAVSPAGHTLYFDTTTYLGGATEQMTALNLTNGQIQPLSNQLVYDPLVDVIDSSRSFINTSPALAISANGQTVYNAEQLQTITTGNPAIAVYNTALQGVQMLSLPTQGTSAGVALSPNGNTLYVLSTAPNPGIVFINPTTQTILHTLPLSGLPLSLSVDGSSLIVGTSTEVDLYNRATGTLTGTITNPQFQSIIQVAAQGNHLGVLTTNGLFLYTQGSGTPPSSNSSSGATSTTESVALAPGWNLVDSLVGQAVASDPNFYWNGTTYLTTGAPNAANAEWVYSAEGSTVTVPIVSNPSTSVTLAPQTWGMIGNPLTLSATVTLQAGDAAFTYNSTTNRYQPVSGSTLTLSPGQGAWLYSAAGGTYTIGMAPPPPPSLG